MVLLYRLDYKGNDIVCGVWIGVIPLRLKHTLAHLSVIAQAESQIRLFAHRGSSTRHPVRDKKIHIVVLQSGDRFGMDNGYILDARLCAGDAAGLGEEYIRCVHE